METSSSVVDRVASLMRAVSHHEPGGAATAVVARQAGVPRPSAHRLLTAMADRGLVERDARSGHWMLGPELFLLGTTASARYDARSIAHPFVRRLADATEESAFFSVRRGEETVCLIREDGAFPIRSHVLYEGARFPLGVVSAGLAVLAFLPEPEIDRFLADNDLSERYGPGHDTSSVRDRLADVRRNGWSLNPGLIVPDSWGMAAAVFDTRQQPIAALSLTGIESRFGTARRRELGRLLLGAALALSKALAHD